MLLNLYLSWIFQGVRLATSLPGGAGIDPANGCGTFGGCTTVHQIVSWIAVMMLFLAAAAFAVCAAMWGAGHLNGNVRAIDNGKSGVATMVFVVLLIGAANVLLGNAWGIGQAWG
jgi:hypothetical protein